MCLAVPLKVMVVESAGNRGVVAMGEGTMDVSFDLVEDVAVGDYVLVHAGMAIERLDEKAALETLELLADLGVVPSEGTGP